MIRDQVSDATVDVVTVDAPYRVPLQRRSKRTLEKILQASMALLNERGLKSTSMTEIAARAGVSVGTLYTRFADKDALVNYLFLYLQETRLTTARDYFRPSSWRGVSLAGRIRHLTEHLIGGASQQTGLLRAFALRQLLEERTEAEADREEEIASLLAAWFQAGAAEDGITVNETRARMAVSMITAGLRSQIVFGISCGVSREALPDELIGAVSAYLGVEVRGAGELKEPEGE